MTPHRRIALILAVLMGTACQAAETAAQQPGDQQAAELPHRVFDQDLPEYGEPYANFEGSRTLTTPPDGAMRSVAMPTPARTAQRSDAGGGW